MVVTALQIHTCRACGNHHQLYNYSYILVAVPVPIVSVTALSNQTVGQSLMLECSVTIARGIHNRGVDIMWSVSNGTVIKTINRVTTNTSRVFIDIYTIPVLSVDDDEEVYVCEGVLNPTPYSALLKEDNITLYVISEYSTVYLLYRCKLFEGE